LVTHHQWTQRSVLHIWYFVTQITVVKYIAQYLMLYSSHFTQLHEYSAMRLKVPVRLPPHIMQLHTSHKAYFDFIYMSLPYHNVLNIIVFSYLWCYSIHVYTQWYLINFISEVNWPYSIIKQKPNKIFTIHLVIPNMERHKV